MEYEPREIWYSFEGGILEIEIPRDYERKSLERINPAQTDDSLLVKAVAKAGE